MRWVGHVARMGEERGVYRVLVGKPEGRRWAGHVARVGEERGCIGSWWGNRREGDGLGMWRVWVRRGGV